MVDSETSVVYGGKFYDATPQPTTEGNQQNYNQYFKPVLPESPGQKIVAVIIPFYNETWEQLNSTIDSLQQCQNLVSNYLFSYFLIQDGWAQAPACMKKELKRTFPHEEYWKELKSATTDEGRNVTYVFQTQDPESQSCTRNTRMKKHITLLVKKDNRKKHNSHQWFFSNNGFCGAMEPAFCFATDCSTQYDERCLKLLLEVMQREENCAVVSGRQVVMTAQQQGSEDTLVESLFRAVQCYDFESSFAAFMGAFAIFGFLPVVPGPCGLYRWSDMKGIPLEWYFEIVNRPPNQCGLVLSNLKIAEDRILSYAAVLKTARQTKMCMHPDAEFYFESETDLGQFVKQRRRWINGTVAGYVYLCAHAGEIFDSNLSTFQKLAVYFLILCQTGMYGIVFVGPAIFLSMLYSTLMWIFSNHEDNLMPFAIFIAYVCFYVYFMATHARQGREYVFVGWMFYTMLLLSVVTMIGMMAGITYYMATKWNGDDIILALPLILAISVVAFPIIISTHRPLSTWRCLKSCIPFYLFLPTLVAWFGSYSVARFWDISWGNRPSGGGAHGEASKDDAFRARMLVQAQAFAAFVLVANLMVVLAYVQTSANPYFLFVVAIMICCFSTLQMLLSFMYFFMNFLMDKLVFRIPELLLEFTHRMLARDFFVPIPDVQPSEKKERPRSCQGYVTAVALTFWQLGVNFAFQSVMQRFQSMPIVDSHHLVSAAFPPLGLVSIFIGFFGDKFNKKQTNNSFRGLAAFGGAVFVVSTMAIRDYSYDYTLLLVRTCLQLFGLHIVNSAAFVLFLKYVWPDQLLSLILVKSLLGVLGNLIPSIVEAATGAESHSNTLELVSMVILCILLFVLMLATSDRPPSQIYKLPTKTQPLGYDTEVKFSNQHYRAAVVLSAFFFFGFALAPMQFQMLSYFEEIIPDHHTALEYYLYGYIGQGAVVFVVACFVLYSNARKGAVSFLTVTALIQLLFLAPNVGNDPKLGLFIVCACGFYRTYVDVFAHYFFALCVHTDTSHIGFWVAGLNVTLAIAQVAGSSMLGQLGLSQDFRTLFGYAGFSCILGIASAWRIYSPAPQSSS